MSQHTFTTTSPQKGEVSIILGYDPLDGAPFMSYETQDGSALLSPPGLGVQELCALVFKRLGVQVPATIADAVQAEIVEARFNVDDVGRRYRCYDSHGALLASRD